MKVLILGGTGMLGHQLWRTLRPRCDAWATIRSAEVPESLRRLVPSPAIVPDVTAENFESVQAAFARVQPDAVINCIGIVKRHEQASDGLACLNVNALFPHHLAKLCRSADCRLIQISTDCVFSGARGNYRETDVSDAVDLYGRTKYLGEVREAGCLTLRTSMIGHELQTQRGLLEWFLSQQGRSVRGFRNAIFSGLTTLALSQLIGDILTRHATLQGFWHVASTPTSKHDLLVLIRKVYRVAIEIEPEVETKCDRSLCGTRFAQATGWQAPAWPAMIEAMHRDWLEARPSQALAS